MTPGEYGRQLAKSSAPLADEQVEAAARILASLEPSMPASSFRRMNTDTKRVAYTREEAARAAGVSLDTIRRAINSGRLRAKRTSTDDNGNPSGRYLVPLTALKDWIEGLPDA